MIYFDFFIKTEPISFPFFTLLIVVYTIVTLELENLDFSQIGLKYYKYFYRKNGYLN